MPQGQEEFELQQAEKVEAGGDNNRILFRQLLAISRNILHPINVPTSILPIVCACACEV